MEKSQELLNYSSTLIFCTWKNCKELATESQVGKDGKIWASLCDEHHKELDDALASGDPKRMVSSWVKAKGGAEKAARGFTDEIFDIALFEERIRARTEAMEWMYHLVEDFKRIAKTHEEKYPRDSYIYEECADMLETHIEDFAREK